MESNNSLSILPDGMSMPYVAIFDSKKEAILEPLTELPLGTFVVGFFYNYREEKEDECEITLETNNPNLIDIPALKTNMPLRVQWGHIFSDGSSKSGPVRTVVLRDIEANFSESGVKYVLKCTDAFAVTKNTRAELKEQMFSTWVKNNLSDKFSIEVIDYTKSHQMFIKKLDDVDDRQRSK